jgi:ABC-type dipeptide/oligopeptide/nickel transport system ATPase component
MIFQEPMTALNPVMPIGSQIVEALHTHHPKLSRKLIKEKVLEPVQKLRYTSEQLVCESDMDDGFSRGMAQFIVLG